jgi:Amidases related to nicotinamidase
MGGSPLLIIDVQKGFINDWTAHVPARVASLQDSFNPVIITRLYNPQKSLYRRLIGWSEFSLGSTETQLAFAPHDGATIIDTSSYNGVDGTLLNRFRSDAVNRVHLCGIATEGAVLLTAVGLFEQGIEPVVLAHACGSVAGHESHEAALQILRRLIGVKQVIGS